PLPARAAGGRPGPPRVGGRTARAGGGERGAHPPARSGLAMTRTAAPARHGRLPEGDDKQHAVEAMFDRIAPRYDRLNRIISLGQDRRWRRHTVAALGLSPGATVLDLGCGSGDLCEVVTADGYAAIGVDFSAGMLAAGHTPAPLARAGALRLPEPHAP